ncbi:unnamed protein product [Acanthoscelides obtectus]|uniref:BTB domain-containing protein n=1 Tax=Acanthoscelides obtectus TaxID=200917 RepID=A0A9P0VTZ5_ACAOB|nr:unnamed protein product [Acanthoscelides obtectus]CAK1682648.1 Rabankyrin-5 [Acanthoscelides obtectus]
MRILEMATPVITKQEYSKLQTKYHDVEFKYNAISASNGKGTDDTFASRLLKTVSSLYNSETYSDIDIILKEEKMKAHKLVLSARSNLWNESMLSNRKELDWSDIETEVAMAIIKLCEQFLISVVTIRSCVKFYSVAEETEASNLLEYCSGLISVHWDDLNSSDFEHMNGPLLYKMLKNKTQYPLHTAVRLQREDVVFLCLVENSSKVSDFFYWMDLSLSSVVPTEYILSSPGYYC